MKMFFLPVLEQRAGAHGSKETCRGWDAGCHLLVRTTQLDAGRHGRKGDREPRRVIGGAAGTPSARCLSVLGTEWLGSGEKAASFCWRTVPARAAVCQGCLPPPWERGRGSLGGLCLRQYSKLLGGCWREGFTLEHLFCFCSLEQDTCFSHKQSHKLPCKQVSRGRKSGAGMTATGSWARR